MSRGEDQHYVVMIYEITIKFKLNVHIDGEIPKASNSKF